MDLENLMLSYADDLAERSKKKKPVIDPESNTIGDVMEVFPDNVTVMDPRNLYVQDSKGILDIRNTPQMLKEFGEAIGSQVKVDADFDMEPSESRQIAVIESEVKDNPELNETMIRLARLIDIHFDQLTDTVRMESNRQLEEMRLTTTAIAQLQDAQVKDSELKEQLQKERLAFEQERDFDNNRPIATPNNPLPVSPYANNEPGQDEGGPSLFDGLFGVGGGRSKGGRLARIGRILGFAVRGLTGLVGVLFLANEVVKKFFGKDLITFVKDGFKYILDNWDTLLMKGISSIMDVIASLPSMIGEAVAAIGATIKSVLLSIFEKVPFLKDMLDIPDTFDEIHDKVTGQGQYAGQEADDSGATAMGTVAALGASVYGAKKLKNSVQGMRKAPETFTEQAVKQGDPDTGRANSTTKKGFFKGKGRLGLLLTVGSLLGLSMGDDEEFVDDQGQTITTSTDPEKVRELREKQRQQIRDYKSAREEELGEVESGLDASTAVAGLTVAGGAAYMMRNRAPETPTELKPTPAGQERALPKPVTGTMATDAVSKQSLGSRAMDKLAKVPGMDKLDRVPGMGKQALKTLGRVPGLSILMAGMDAYNISQDDTLSDRERTKEYAGAGGSLAGGAAGAALGATLGSVIPFFGTAVGGIAGGLAGAYLGEEGVESLVDWFTGPEPSEGQSATGTGVGAENIELDSAEQERRMFGHLFSSDEPKTVGEGTVLAPEVGPTPAPVPYAPPDQQQARAEEEAKKIRERAANSISEAKAEQMARANTDAPPVSERAEVKTNIEQQMVDRESLDMIPGPAMSGEPTVVEQPGVETSLPPGETFRDQSPVRPEMNVTVTAPETKEKPKAVAKAVKPQVKDKVGHTSGYDEKPNLSNVPVTIEDATFALVQLGYV